MKKEKTLPGNQKPVNFRIFLLLPILCFCGYHLGAMVSEGHLIGKDFIQIYWYYISHPFPLVFDSYTFSGMFIGVGIVLLIFLYQLSMANNRRPGEEYGNARFISAEEITSKYGDENDDDNKIYGEDLRISIHTKTRNLNATILGGSGTGKTFRIVVPNLMQANSSYVVLDAKGTIYKQTAEYLKRQGYKIKILNLADPKHSMHYNPFQYVKTQDDIVSMVHMIIKATTPKDATKGEPFWEHAESAFLQALCFYTWLSDDIPTIAKDFHMVIKLLGESNVNADPKALSPMDKRINALAKKQWKVPETGEMLPGDQHPAVVMYRAVMASAEDTKRSIVLSCVARLEFLINSPAILSILRGRDEMQLDCLGMGYKGHKQKTALYLIPPLTSDTHNSIITLCYSQLFNTLYTQAEQQTDNCSLPIQVSVYMDEMGNIPVPPNFEKTIATCRSYGIDISVFLQSLQQLKTLFKDNWRTIVGCCDAFLFLGMGNDYESLHEVSELMGHYSLQKRSTSRSKGSSGSTSETDDVIQRSLLLEQELRTMSNDDEILIFRGEQPCIAKKFKTENSEQFQYAQELGVYHFEGNYGLSALSQQIPSVQVLSKEEKEFEEKESGQPVIMLDFASLDRMADKKVEFQSVLSKEIMQAYMAANMVPRDVPDKSEPETSASVPLPEKDTIKSRMAKYAYNNAQIEQAAFAATDGLSEQQILEWFSPDTTAEDMERLRLNQTHFKKPLCSR